MTTHQTTDSSASFRIGRGHEILAGRGLAFLRRALLKILEPICSPRAYYVFENRIIPPSETTSRVVRGIEVMIRRGESDLERTRSEIEGMGDLTTAEIENRFRSGYAVAVAYDEQGRPVGCCWMAEDNGPKLIFDVRWKIGESEAVFYDTFVVPERRGQGIQKHFDAVLNNYVWERGIRHCYATVKVGNAPSLRLGRLPEKSVIMMLLVFRLPGLKRTSCLTRRGAFEDRFERTGKL